jgi:hypothetical protein
MRIALVHPKDHSGGAEIAGNWPPAAGMASPPDVSSLRSRAAVLDE